MEYQRSSSLCQIIVYKYIKRYLRILIFTLKTFKYLFLL